MALSQFFQVTNSSPLNLIIWAIGFEWNIKIPIISWKFKFFQAAKLNFHNSNSSSYWFSIET